MRGSRAISRGFVLPDMPESFGAPSFDDPYWANVLEMCNETGTPINFHLNAAINPEGLTWKSFGFEKALAVVSNMFYIGNLATMGNWMVSGLLDRYSKLKIGLIESGMGWIPFGIGSLSLKYPNKRIFTISSSHANHFMGTLFQSATSLAAPDYQQALLACVAPPPTIRHHRRQAGSGAGSFRAPAIDRTCAPPHRPWR